MELLEFDAYSLVPNNGKYQKKRVKEFFKSDEFKSSFFTNDTKTTQFYYPNTNARVITHLDYLIQLKDEFVIPNTFIGFFEPVEKFQLKVVVDNDIDLDFHFFHVNNDTLNYKKTVGKKTTEHLWTFTEIQRTKYFGDAPNIRWFVPHISFNIKGYHTENGYKNVLTDLNDLYKLYQKWISLIPEENQEKLEEILSEVVTDSQTELEKLEKIYYWVQSNIKYIAHTDGLEGFVPRSGTDVATCRFGDCKGMSNLTRSLASLAGIKTYRTWIGSRDIPYTYEELNTPLVDNHMILSYLMKDSVIFLDATDSYLPFGYPTEFIQGKQALIALDSNTYRLADVPIPDGGKNEWIDSTWVKVENENIKGTGKLFMSGYHANRWRHEVKHRDKTEMLEFASAYLLKGDNRFVISDFKVSDEENSMAMSLEYDFTIRNYVNQNNDDIYINMNLETGFGEDQIENDRTIPIELSYYSNSKNVVILEIPESYKLGHLPKNCGHSMEDFGYSISYAEDGHNLTYTLDYYANSLIMQPNTFKDWNELSKQFRKDVRTNIVLTKNP